MLQLRRILASGGMSVTALSDRFGGSIDSCLVGESLSNDRPALGLDRDAAVLFHKLPRRVGPSRSRLACVDFATAEGIDHFVCSLHEVFFGIDGKVNRVPDGSDCRIDVFSDVLRRIIDGVHDNRIHDVIVLLRSNCAHILVLPAPSECTGRRVDQMLGGDHVRVDAWGESGVRITHAVGAEPFLNCGFLVSEDDTDLQDATI
jgi:hypothetical protein